MPINRRKFCQYTLLGALGAILSPRRLFAATRKDSDATRRLCGKCTVEVVRCQCFSELQGRYLSDPEAGPCSRFNVGDKITVTPDNLEATKNSSICPHAWRSLEPYIMAALSQGEAAECSPALKETQAVISCPDGTRPVIFKVTAG